MGDFERWRSVVTYWRAVSASMQSPVEVVAVR